MVDKNMEVGQEVPLETRVWQAVIASTIKEWVSGTLRQRREAEAYLFSDNADFKMVCQSAGMEVSALQSRLQKYRRNNPDNRVRLAA